jgi:hypothetical protein
MRARISADLKLLASEVETETSERSSESIRRVLHHDLLFRIEDYLFGMGAAVDLNSARSTRAAADPRDLLGSSTYVRAEGHAIIEDYERLKGIAQRFNDLQTTIARSGVGDALEDQLAGVNAQLQRAQLEYAASEGKRKTDALVRAATLQGQVRATFLSAAGLDEIPDWLIEAIELWIDAFMPGRISVRIVPFHDHPEFQVISNLRRTYFSPADLDTLRLTYGALPDQDLTVFGLVTSLPAPRPESFDFLAGLHSNESGDRNGETPRRDEAMAAEDIPRQVFERAFRAMFGAIDELEAFVRFVRYPSVVVHPIAIYRTIRAPSSREPLVPKRSWMKRALALARTPWR